MLPHAIRFADTPFPSLLRHGKQGIKVSLLFHQFVKGSGFGNTAVLQNQYPVIPAQKRFLQSVSHNDPGHSGKIQQIGCDLVGRLGIQRRSGFVRQQDGGSFQQAPGNGYTLFLSAGKFFPFSPQM